MGLDVAQQKAQTRFVARILEFQWFNPCLFVCNAVEVTLIFYDGDVTGSFGVWKRGWLSAGKPLPDFHRDFDDPSGSIDSLNY